MYKKVALVALAASEQVGVFHGAGGGQCTWNDLAAETFSRAGVACRATATTSATTAPSTIRTCEATLRGPLNTMNTRMPLPGAASHAVAQPHSGGRPKEYGQ